MNNLVIFFIHFENLESMKFCLNGYDFFISRRNRLEDNRLKFGIYLYTLFI